MQIITAFVPRSLKLAPTCPSLFQAQAPEQQLARFRNRTRLAYGLSRNARPEFVSACMVATVVTLLMLLSMVVAQAAPAQRIKSAIDATVQAKIAGNRHPLARPEFDQGAVDSSMPMRVTMVFKMTAAQQAELDALLAAQQQRGSPDYQRWLTPEQFGDRFGLSPGDIDKVTAWLEGEGFHVEGVPASRNMIAFSGTAQQVKTALHTDIRRYIVKGEEHFANSSDPSVPAALADVALNFRGLNNFRLKPRARRAMDPKFTSGVSGNHFLTSGDVVTIYDVKPLYNKGFDGTGQKIAVVGQSDVAMSDIQAFRSNSGLPANDPQPSNSNSSPSCPCVGLVVPGDADPGLQSNDIDEANLDVEWAGTMAPKATVIFIVGDPVKGGGVFDALIYAITTSPIPAPIVSTSYGVCEQFVGSSGITAFANLMQQANAQGITILAPAGDTGAADCDFNPGPPNAITVSTMGLGVDFPGALANVTSVGGTEFNEAAGTYWAPAAGVDVISSAFSYIPETSWNDTNANLGNGMSAGLTATGGGSSAFVAKPAWQAGTGVPNDGARDVPDISLSASQFHDAYLICSENFDSTNNTFSPTCVSPFGFRDSVGGNLAAVGGTSVGPPTMAGIVALINQATNHSTGSGNINPILYQLAAQAPTAFHDVVTGNNQVPFSAACAANTQIGYNAASGYDLATGLGSIDAFVMITNWTSVAAASAGNSTLVDFSVALSPTQLTVKAGSCGIAQLTLAPLHGFSGTPSFTCMVASGLGSTTCAVVPAASSSLLVPRQFSDPNWRWPAGVVFMMLLVSAGILTGSIAFSWLCSARWSWRKLAPVVSVFALCVLGLSCGGGSNNNVATAVAPSVTAQPMNQTVVEGQTATFSVSANGTAPLRYQWLKNGSAISGATTSSYTTPAITASDQGDQFSVTVSNSAGTAVSNAATLNVNVPYNFVVQVPSTTAAGSGTVTVTAQIGGITHTAQMTLNVN